jgi:hypothetical protein
MRTFALEHFHQICNDVPKGPVSSGLFGFRLPPTPRLRRTSRFGSVTGFFKPAPSPKPRQKPKILAAHRYIFSVNALILSLGLWQLNRTPARAADFDGAKPFVVTVKQVEVCDRTGELEKNTAEDVNLPKSFSIDVGKKLVTSKEESGETRTTPIETVRHENGTLILAGVQLGKAWHAVVNEQTGKTTITCTTEDTAFVVFADGSRPKLRARRSKALSGRECPVVMPSLQKAFTAPCSAPQSSGCWRQGAGELNSSLICETLGNVDINQLVFGVE